MVFEQGRIVVQHAAVPCRRSGGVAGPGQNLRNRGDPVDAAHMSVDPDRRQNDLRIALHHFGVRGHEYALVDIGEDVDAAGDADHVGFRRPAARRPRTLVVDLQVDAHGAQSGRTLLDLADFGAQAPREGSRLHGPAERRADFFGLLEDCFKRIGLEVEHAQPAFSQPGRGFPLERSAGEDQAGFERGDGVRIGARKRQRADLARCAVRHRFGRENRGIGHRRQPVLLAQQVDRFRQRSREADDVLLAPGQRGP